jgi:hypothetical protein
MRLLVLVIVTSLGAGPSLAQTNIGGSSASGAAPGSPDGNPISLNHRLPSAAVPPAEDPQRPSLRPQPNPHDSAVADCVLMSLGGEAVRASSSVFAAAMFFAGTNTSDAVNRLSPKEIQAEFFNGAPFTSLTPSNTKFTMVLLDLLVAHQVITDDSMVVVYSQMPRAAAPSASSSFLDFFMLL